MTAGSRRCAACRIGAVDVLALTPETTVLDVGCGTGASFPLLSARVGPSGRIVGVDNSGGMLHIARQRAGDEGRHDQRRTGHPLEPARPPPARRRCRFADAASDLPRDGTRAVVIVWRGPRQSSPWRTRP